MGLKRWPIIRHVRFWWLRRRVYSWARFCALYGLGLGHPNEADLSHLERIWRGKA